MCYLWIKEDDAKTFKSFLSGNEIEVGLYVNPSNSVFETVKELEIFYGEQNDDAYRAKVKRHEVLPMITKNERSYVKLSLVKA